MTGSGARADGEVRLLRFGLVGAGGLLLYLALSLPNLAPPATAPGNVLLPIAAGAGGLGLLASAAIGKPPDYLRWLILGAYVATFLIRAAVRVQTTPAAGLVTIDSGLYTELAAELLRGGENPYTWDFGGVYDLYRVRQDASTPRLNGAIESNFPYPALGIWLVVPVQALGLPGVFSLSVVAHVLVFLLLFLAAPKSAQPLILLPLAAGFDFTLLTLLGNMDILWVAVLTAMALAWPRPALRAILFGLACSLKQIPWLLAPFLAIRIWHESGANRSARRVGRFVVLSGATFLVFNGPFILWSPTPWLAGVFEPLHDDLVFLSQGGLSTLTQFGLVYLPKGYYLIATLATMGLLLLWYWRHHGALRDTLWIMPGILMWFSYRSLVSYWVYAAFPMLAVLARPTEVSTDLHTRPAPGRSWRLTAAITIAVLAGLVALAGAVSTQVGPIDVRLWRATLDPHGRVAQMQVQVTNHSRKVITPRFAVQNLAAITNPLPWTIDEGAAALQSGQTATYQISSQRTDRTFFAHEAAQLVVTDAAGDYALRGVLTITPDRSFLWPDAIPNPTYRYWDSGQRAPSFWGLTSQPQSAGSAALAQHAGRAALALQLKADGGGTSRVALETWTIFPQAPFGIWVYSGPPAEESTAVAYGLEVADGPHRLWVLFGAQPYTGPLVDGQYVIHRAVQPGRWTFQELDLAGAYADAGWPLPDLRRTAYRGLDVDLRLVHVRLFLQADGPVGTRHAYFGPIYQDYQIQPQALMEETLAEPGNYYLRLADTYRQDRNHAHARAALQRAHAVSHGDASSLNWVDRLRKQLVGERSR